MNMLSMYVHVTVYVLYCQGGSGDISSKHKVTQGIYVHLDFLFLENWKRKPLSWDKIQIACKYKFTYPLF